MHPCAGSGGLADFFSRNGRHEGVIEAGDGNALIGLLASSDFAGRVVQFDAQPV